MSKEQREFNASLLRKGMMICRNSQFCKGRQIGIHGRMFGVENGRAVPIPDKIRLKISSVQR